MANKSASAKKRVRQNIKRRLRNKSVLSNLKSRIKVFKAAVDSNSLRSISNTSKHYPDSSLHNIVATPEDSKIDMTKSTKLNVKNNNRMMKIFDDDDNEICGDNTGGGDIDSFSSVRRTSDIFQLPASSTEKENLITKKHHKKRAK